MPFVCYTVKLLNEVSYIELVGEPVWLTEYVVLFGLRGKDWDYLRFIVLNLS